VEVKVKLYIGQKDDLYSDILFVDLFVGENAVSLYEEDIEGVDAVDFGEILADALETAKFFSDGLKIPIKIDSGIAELVEEFETEDRTRIKRLVREFLEE